MHCFNLATGCGTACRCPCVACRGLCVACRGLSTDDVDARIRAAVRAALDEVAGELRRLATDGIARWYGTGDAYEHAARIVEARRDRDG